MSDKPKNVDFFDVPKAIWAKDMDKKFKELNEHRERLHKENENLIEEMSNKKTLELVNFRGIYNETQWGNNILIYTGELPTSITTKTQWGANLSVQVTIEDKSQTSEVMQTILDHLYTIIEEDSARDTFDEMDWHVMKINGAPPKTNKPTYIEELE